MGCCLSLYSFMWAVSECAFLTMLQIAWLIGLQNWKWKHTHIQPMRLAWAGNLNAVSQQLQVKLKVNRVLGVHGEAEVPLDIRKYWYMVLAVKKTFPQFNSVQSFYQLGRWGNMRDDSAEVFFQTFLQESLVSSSGMGRDVLSLILSHKHFLCRTWGCPATKVPWRMVLERLSWLVHVTCPNPASFPLLTVARTGSCWPTRKFIVLPTQSLVSYSK